jgi:hypothetical protein
LRFGLLHGFLGCGGRAKPQLLLMVDDSKSLLSQQWPLSNSKQGMDAILKGIRNLQERFDNKTFGFSEQVCI